MNDKHEILKQLARSLQAEWEAQGATKSNFLARYNLSDKQLARAAEGTVPSNRMDTWIARYDAVLKRCRGINPDKDYHEKMPFCQAMDKRLALLERTDNDRRILVCLAPNGCGKTAWAEHARAEDMSKRVVVRMRPTWKNRLGHICDGIATALGLSPTTSNPKKLEAEVIGKLKSRPITLIIDQAHEGGVALMHLLRAFVDETDCRFVYLAYDTAFRAVVGGSTDALIEAQAFIGRCLKPIFRTYANGIGQEDVEAFLKWRCEFTPAKCKSLGHDAIAELAHNTNLRLLEDAIEHADANASGEVTPAAISLAILYLLDKTPPVKEAA